MANFSKARSQVKRWEGGYSPGFTGSGETYRGIDRKYNPTWEGWKIIDKIPNKKQGQFFNNSELERLVDNWHYQKYWLPSRAEEIVNDYLSTFFFDFYFHKPAIAVAAANVAAKEINPGVFVSSNKISDGVLKTMNTNPVSIYEDMYNLREQHYKNKWMNRDAYYSTTQKGVLNRLYSFLRSLPASGGAVLFLIIGIAILYYIYNN